MKLTARSKWLFFTGLLMLTGANSSGQAYYLKIPAADSLKSFFRHTSDRVPLVSAHRGGPTAGFPENCLATFDHTLRQTYALIECDVQLTKDSVLAMMHDDGLERTTNGTGKLSAKTWAELQQIKLKDNDGKLTDFSIPTLDQVLQWAKGKTIVQVDVKKGIPPRQIVDAIHKNGAQAYAIVITYSVEAAKQYHQLDSSLMLSVSVRNADELKRLEQAGVNLHRVAAFVGITEPSPELYELLHQRGIFCILGTMGNLDRRAAARQGNVYAQLIRNGADILATDFPVQAATAIKELIPADSSKEVFFGE